MSREESTGVALAHVPDVGASGAQSQSGLVPRLHRFRMGLFALLGVGTAALVAAIALSVSGRMSTSDGTWSAWSPTTGGLSGPQQIADSVAPYSRATPAEQLAVVT